MYKPGKRELAGFPNLSWEMEQLERDLRSIILRTWIATTLLAAGGGAVALYALLGSG